MFVKFVKGHVKGVYSVTMTITVCAKPEIPAKDATFRGVAFDGFDESKPHDHWAQVLGGLEHIAQAESVLVRIHSKCTTSEEGESLRCECCAQRKLARRKIIKEGAGIIIILDQEGRGIGLKAKLMAYELQALGMDTFEANELLGLPGDARSYEVAAEMLLAMGVRGKIRLMTNNTDKIRTLEEYGFEVEHVPLQVRATKYSRAYLEAKKAFGQMISGAKLVPVEPRSTAQKPAVTKPRVRKLERTG